MAGAAAISNIHDIRPVLPGAQGTVDIAVFQAFQPLYLVSTFDNWSVVIPFAYKFYAHKPSDKTAMGVLPLTLPGGATIQRFRLQGTTFGDIHFVLVRIQTQSSAGWGW